jgi:hypothetical protein
MAMFRNFDDVLGQTLNEFVKNSVTSCSVIPLQTIYLVFVEIVHLF